MSEHEVKGVNVIGFLRAEFGQGEAARRIVSALDRADIPVATVAYSGTSHREEHPFADRGPASYTTNVVCLNAEHLLEFVLGPGGELLADRYSAALWFWETSRWPEYLRPALDLVDEVWVASEFVAEAVAGATHKPVLVLPLPVEPPRETQLGRRDIGLPDDAFLITFAFDFFSTVERKNPLGLIEAFKLAFPPGSGPVLLVKTINGGRHRRELQRVRQAAQGRPDIFIRDGYVSPDDMSGLIALCDCYVSLHRSEGFGLPLAEAMARGKPVIGTGYSGNLTFMNEENSFLVPYTLTGISPDAGPYPPDGTWAEPDVEAAASLMRLVYEDQETALKRGELARATMRKKHSLEQTSAWLASRLREIERLAPERPRSLTPAGRAASYIARGPSIPWNAASHFGAVGRVGRQLVRRSLRPYLSRHREFESAVAAGLREGERLGERVERMAVPELADPNALRVRDAAGHITIGYGSLGSASLRLAQAFAGSEEMVRDRLRAYLPLFVGHDPVVVSDCGRGEFLDVLAEARVAAVGVEADADLAEHARQKGHSVEIAEPIAYLEAQPEETVSAIFDADVLEQLEVGELRRFLTCALRALTPEGVLVAEATNPSESWAPAAFWADPLNRRPVFPESAVALCALAGFGWARIVFPGGSGRLESDRRSKGRFAVVAGKSDASAGSELA